nr:hypothetical protein [Paenibacillus caui]
MLTLIHLRRRDHDNGRADRVTEREYGNESAVDTDTPTEAAILSIMPTMLNCGMPTKKLIRVSM